MMQENVIRKVTAGRDVASPKRVRYTAEGIPTTGKSIFCFQFIFFTFRTLRRFLAVESYMHVNETRCSFFLIRILPPLTFPRM